VRSANPTRWVRRVAASRTAICAWDWASTAATLASIKAFWPGGDVGTDPAEGGVGSSSPSSSFAWRRCGGRWPDSPPSTRGPMEAPLTLLTQSGNCHWSLASGSGAPVLGAQQVYEVMPHSTLFFLFFFNSCATLFSTTAFLGQIFTIICLPYDLMHTTIW